VVVVNGGMETSPTPHQEGRDMTRLEELCEDIAHAEHKYLTGYFVEISRWRLVRLYAALAGYRDAVLDRIEQERSGQ
jgi:hypothetical protein